MPQDSGLIRSFARSGEIPLALFGFLTLPLWCPLIFADRQLLQLKARKAAGNPPFVPPGHLVSDYVDQFLVHPWQRRKDIARATQDISLCSYPTLPPELCHLILDYLTDDRSTLSACSLVCRTWLYSTRIHMFTNITLTRFRAYQFIKLIRSPFCTFLPHMRSVKMEDEPYWTIVDPLMAQLVALHAERGTPTLNVRKLDLTSTGLHALSPHLFTPLNVTELHFTGLWSWYSSDGFSMEYVVRLIGTFPRLEILKIAFPKRGGKFHHLEEAHTLMETVQPPAGLQELCIRLETSWRDTGAALLHWLLKSAPRLTSLEILYELRSEDYAVLIPYLTDYGELLIHVGLSGWKCEQFTEMLQNKEVVAEQLTNLTSVAVHYTRYPASRESSLQALIHQLCTLCASNIRTITISSADVSDGTWKPLPNVLLEESLKRRLESMQEFKFVETGCSTQGMMTFLRP